MIIDDECSSSGSLLAPGSLIRTTSSASPTAARCPERVYQAFKRRVRKHQVPYLSPHGLRHTWATIALANGVHPRVAQEHLGHAHISITLQTYSHVQPTMHDEAAVLVANLVLPEG